MSTSMDVTLNYGYFADDIAVDWISLKLYWTESGLQNRIRVLDLMLGHVASVVNLRGDVNPRAIVVDPVNRYVTLRNYATILELSVFPH